jgi:hypothetical protein
MGPPQCDNLLAVRGRPLSQLTFLSENHHRAVHTGRLRAATLADMARSRIRFAIRVSPLWLSNRVGVVRDRRTSLRQNRRDLSILDPHRDAQTDLEAVDAVPVVASSKEPLKVTGAFISLICAREGQVQVAFGAIGAEP